MRNQPTLNAIDYIAKRAKKCWPKSQVVRKNGKILLTRAHFEAEENVTNPKTLSLLISGTQKTWRRLIDLQGEYPLRLKIDRADYLGLTDRELLPLECQNSDCGYKWPQTYNNLFQSVRRKQYLDSRLKPFALCPKCLNIHIIRPATKASRFAAMSDDELLNYARSLPLDKTRTKIGSFDCEVTLFKEMQLREKNGESLLVRFGRERNWRRRRPELYEFSLNDWREFVMQRQICSVSDWKLEDSHSLNVISKNRPEYFESIKKELLEPKMLIFKGDLFQSRAELLVAHFLDANKIQYNAHPPYCFSYTETSQRVCVGDFEFQLSGKSFFVEVWMAGREVLSPNENFDEYLGRYLENRDDKTKNIMQLYPDHTLIQVEARVFRDYGADAYFSYLDDVFFQFGIPTTGKYDPKKCIDSARIDVAKWTADEFFEECIVAGWRQITDMPATLQNAVRKNQEIKETLAHKLARHFRRTFNTRFKRAEFAEVVSYISKRPELHSKLAYQDAVKKGILPPGFPANPLSHYDISNWCEVWGEEPHEFVQNYEKAKTIVWQYNFKSLEEFKRARASDDPKYAPLKWIKASPNAPQGRGGYDDYKGIRDFLGLEIPWRERESGIELLKVLEFGSVKSVLKALRHDCQVSKKGDLRELYGAISIDAINRNINVIEIEILAFGNTSFLNTDLTSLFQNVPSHYYATEKTWRCAREQRKGLRRFPAKLYRYLPDHSLKWSDVIKYAKQLGFL